MRRFLLTPLCTFAATCDMQLLPEAWPILARHPARVKTVADWIVHHRCIAIRARQKEDFDGKWGPVNSDDMRDFDRRVYRAFVRTFVQDQGVPSAPLPPRDQLAKQLYEKLESGQGQAWLYSVLGQAWRRSRLAPSSKCQLYHRRRVHRAHEKQRALQTYLNTLVIANSLQL